MGSNNIRTLKEMEVSFSQCVALPAGGVVAGCEYSASTARAAKVLKLEPLLNAGGSQLSCMLVT